jgi:hypothetical protein
MNAEVPNGTGLLRIWGIIKHPPGEISYSLLRNKK